MKEFKGTIGPWAVDWSGFAVVGKDGRGVVDYDYCQFANEEGILNAKLIAAAPDLLEALQAAMDYIDAIPKDVVLPVMPGFDRDWVDGVISKALGE